MGISTFNVLNKKEKFTQVEPRYSSGPSLEANQSVENYQNQVVVNAGTSADQINQYGAMYYANLQNYLNPSLANLQLAQNISASPNYGGPTQAPGAANSYSDANGSGYVDNLGYLNNETYPPVSYANDRVSQLSQCARDLPMFAASSLLPKPSANADNNALSQSAARALAAFTALAPVEQIGAITSINTPYSKTSDIRALDQIPMKQMQTPLFNASPSTYISTVYGQVNSSTLGAGASGYGNVSR